MGARKPKRADPTNHAQRQRADRRRIREKRTKKIKRKRKFDDRNDG